MECSFRFAIFKIAAQLWQGLKFLMKTRARKNNKSILGKGYNVTSVQDLVDYLDIGRSRYIRQQTYLIYKNIRISLHYPVFHRYFL